MAQTIREASEEISEKQKVSEAIVLNMFGLIHFNNKHRSQIEERDLKRFAKDNNIKLKRAAEILADCTVMALEGLVEAKSKDS